MIPHLASFALLLSGTPAAEPTHYRIPEGFRGLVVVVHGERCGQHMEDTKGLRTITVPEDGIVIVKEAVEADPKRMDCVFVDKNGRSMGPLGTLVTTPSGRTYAEDGSDADGQAIYATFAGTWVEGDGTDKITYTQLFVGTPGEIDVQLSAQRKQQVIKAVSACRGR